jgi:hypothetical protein
VTSDGTTVANGGRIFPKIEARWKLALKPRPKIPESRSHNPRQGPQIITIHQSLSALHRVSTSVFLFQRRRALPFATTACLSQSPRARAYTDTQHRITSHRTPPHSPRWSRLPRPPDCDSVCPSVSARKSKTGLTSAYRSLAALYTDGLLLRLAQCDFSK